MFFWIEEKKEYPRLRIIISGDALYASKQVIEIRREKGWKYLIRFKEETIPTLYREFVTFAVSYKNNWHNLQKLVKSKYVCTVRYFYILRKKFG